MDLRSINKLRYNEREVVEEEEEEKKTSVFRYTQQNDFSIREVRKFKSG
jgi:hypothetical protein